MREESAHISISKASSEASNDASPGAFCVQSVLRGAGGASRSARVCKAGGASRASEQRAEGEVRTDGGDYKMQIH